jgi:hypothetical protein
LFFKTNWQRFGTQPFYPQNIGVRATWRQHLDTEISSTNAKTFYQTEFSKIMTYHINILLLLLLTRDLGLSAGGIVRLR